MKCFYLEETCYFNFFLKGIFLSNTRPILILIHTRAILISIQLTYSNFFLLTRLEFKQETLSF